MILWLVVPSLPNSSSCVITRIKVMESRKHSLMGANSSVFVLKHWKWIVNHDVRLRQIMKQWYVIHCVHSLKIQMIHVAKWLLAKVDPCSMQVHQSSSIQSWMSHPCHHLLLYPQLWLTSEIVVPTIVVPLESMNHYLPMDAGLQMGIFTRKETPSSKDVTPNVHVVTLETFNVNPDVTCSKVSDFVLSIFLSSFIFSFYFLPCISYFLSTIVLFFYILPFHVFTLSFFLFSFPFSNTRILWDF